MKIAKSTIEKCREAGFNVYAAKKETNIYGTWIIVKYATRYFKNGVCVALSTPQESTIEGGKQADIIHYFCNR